jgi:pantothenate kinase
VLHATGGGAFKYTDLFMKEFDQKVTLKKYDEMQSLVDGMYFVLNYAKEPSYTFREGEGKKVFMHVPPMQEKNNEDGQIDSYSAMSDSVSTGFLNPEKCKMLVSIGSGVSMIKVSNNGKF